MVVSSSLTTHSAGSASTVAAGEAGAGARTGAGSAARATLPPGIIAHWAKGMTAQVAASVLNHFFMGNEPLMGPFGRRIGKRGERKASAELQPQVNDRVDDHRQEEEQHGVGGRCQPGAVQDPPDRRGEDEGVPASKPRPQPGALLMIVD